MLCRRVILIVVLALMPALLGTGCPVANPPVNPATYAGCWRFTVRMAATDVARDFVDREFVITIDAAGQVASVLMSRDRVDVSLPTDPNAAFVELISGAAATTLQNSFFAARIGLDPNTVDVAYSASISANQSGFAIDASLILVAANVTRYRLAVTLGLDGPKITSVTGTFRDGAFPGGQLNIQQLFNASKYIAGKVDCLLNSTAACDRFYQNNAASENIRFTAFDPNPGLAGRAVMATNATLQFFDLATSALTPTLGLTSGVQGRMAVDAARRRLYATIRNGNGNNALAVVDLDSGALLRTVELKPAGCVDNGQRLACAVVPSTGQVLVVESDAANTAFDGIIRVDPIAGQVLGALQNAHLTTAAFSQPADLVIFEAHNVAVVGNTGAATVTLVPLDAVTRDIRGGDTLACQTAAKSGTLTTTAPEGTAVNGIAADVADDRGVVLLRGTNTASLDGRYQTYTVAGSGAAASVALAAGTPLNRSTRLFGIEIDPDRNEAYIVNGDQATFRVTLGTGAVAGLLGNAATAPITYVAPILGRNRLIQAGNNNFFGEYCLP